VDLPKHEEVMPTYDYVCRACKKQMEIFHSITEEKKVCPLCGEPKLKRMIGPGSGFIFRGSGFYITDYRSSDYLSKAKAESDKTSSPEKSSTKDSKKPKAEDTPKSSAKAS
jgi:putative FmdB family regulatory protein